MIKRLHRKSAITWLAPFIVAAGAYACGSSAGENAANGGGNSGGTSGTGSGHGADCTSDAECSSGVCGADGTCLGNGDGAPSGSPCASNDECASTSCEEGTCAVGTDLPDGASCSAASECATGECESGVCGGPETPGTGTGGTSGTGAGSAGSPCSLGTECLSGLCVSGTCSAGTGTGSGTSTTPGPHFDGSGSGFRPLTTGCGPETATQCTGECEQAGGDPDTTVIRPPATLCFSGDGDNTPEDPAVVIEQVIEKVDGVEYVHLRVTFDPAFTDNTFGEGACCGWGQNRGHTFDPDLSKSDHTELLLTNADGATVMHFKVDLVSPSTESACGYETLGVSGGDGDVLVGQEEWVLAAATSLSRNINGCGYCESEACGSSGDCTLDSPATDENYTPNEATPDWDYRQVYEVWISMDAFGDSGFGQGYITYTHSSPAKGQETLTVEPSPCPPEWDEPYCPPSVIAEGGNCFGTPGGGGSGSGGTSGSGGGTSTGGTTNTGGTTGTGGSGSGGCPPNQQTYVTTEGASMCTPIPFANYPGMAPCPAGYHLDLLSEGQYCLPD